MPPTNTKNSLKSLNKERKLEKKKWKEQKLLKAATELKKEILKPTQTQGPTSIGLDNLAPNEQNEVSNTGTTFTISMALPGSILENAQTPELRTYLAGQIARAACIYCVDEIIVFDDGDSKNNAGIHQPGENSCGQLARVLQYLECPQYLRKFIFPLHKDLQYAGLLNPLDAPHHLRITDDFCFREGVVSHHQARHGKGSWVNVGLHKEVNIDKALTPDIRVTVRLDPQKDGSKKRTGTVVSPSQPKKELGVYWGYTVRLASSLTNVFAKSPYLEGYDLTIGTSDKGSPLSSCSSQDFASFKHLLIVFGGLAGLEAALESDENLNINDVKLLFDKYLNTCPNQGSRTIRTEEAILISLAQITARINQDV